MKDRIARPPDEAGQSWPPSHGRSGARVHGPVVSVTRSRLRPRTDRVRASCRISCCRPNDRHQPRRAGSRRRRRLHAMLGDLVTLTMHIRTCILARARQTARMGRIGACGTASLSVRRPTRRRLPTPPGTAGLRAKRLEADGERRPWRQRDSHPDRTGASGVLRGDLRGGRLRASRVRKTSRKDAAPRP